jgi:hypothetical protein
VTTPTTVNVRLKLRSDTAANWTSANPTLLSGELGLETDTKKLKVGNGSTAWNSLAYFPSIVTGGTVLGNLEIGTTGTLTFEGSTADGFETTLAVTDPTADRTITLPNVSGTVVTTGDTGSVTSTMLADGTIVDGDVNASAAIAGTKISPNFGSQTVQTTGIFSHALGTNGAPTITFTGDTNTGIYSPGADQVAISTSGTGRLIVGSTGTVNIAGAGTAGVTQAVSFNGSAPVNSLVIDSSGRLLVGTSSGYVTSTSATTQPLLQIHSTNTHEAQVSINSWSTGTATGANLSLCRSDSGTVGTHTAVGSTDVLGAIRFSGSDGDQFIEGASIAASADGTWGDNDGPTKLVFSVTADGSASPTEALRISSNRAITVSDGGNVALGTTTGTKIGTATTQKLGFYNATPVVQPAAVADATTAVDVITQLNNLLAKLRTLGIIAT